MKFSALALDYDGTIAVDGQFDPDVRRAIADIRRHGIAVVLVTGRRLSDLRRVAEDLTCFDVLVCENGAVLQFPATGRHVTLAHPPPAAFVKELTRRGIPFEAGETVVEADAAAAPAILDVVRKLEQPLVLAFNRSRLMVLPQAIAKSTGLRRALAALRLSIHNTIGVGDAENDHDLLDACEVGVAVEWGSRALRAIADEVIAGKDPSAVATYVRRVAKQPRLSATQMGRRRVLLGYEHQGAPVKLAIRGRTILIAGEPGTGKSWLAGLICEQLILQGYCLCILDPEGDYRPLERLPGVITLGGDEPPPHGRELLRALRHPDVSVIVDLSKLAHADKREYVHTLLPLLISLRRRTGLPHKILLDEAHYFLGGTDAAKLIDPELAGYILATYRISDLDPAIRAIGDAVVMVTRETNARESDALLELCRPGPGALSRDTFALPMGDAVLLPGPEEASGGVRRFQLAPRLTTHVRHRTKYFDMPVPMAQAFVFEDGTANPATTLRDFLNALERESDEQIADHARRNDFSRWVHDVFRDGSLAARLHTIEQRVLTDPPRTIADGISQAIRARYDLTNDAAT